MVTRIRLVRATDPQQGLPGVKVALFDRDIQDPDDHLSTGETDAAGEVLFKFDSDQYTDSEDSELWRIDSMPDLYVVIYNRSGEVILSTRSETQENKLPELITVPISEELIQAHGLLAE